MWIRSYQRLDGDGQFLTFTEFLYGWKKFRNRQWWCDGCTTWHLLNDNCALQMIKILNFIIYIYLSTIKRIFKNHNNSRVSHPTQGGNGLWGLLPSPCPCSHWLCGIISDLSPRPACWAVRPLPSGGPLHWLVPLLGVCLSKMHEMSVIFIQVSAETPPYERSPPE